MGNTRIKEGEFSYQHKKERIYPGRKIAIVGIFIILLSCFAGTQHFAMTVGKNRLAGGVKIAGIKFYQPFKLFTWSETYKHKHGNYKPFKKSFLLLFLGSGSGILCLILGTRLSLSSSRSAKTVHGSAQFAKRKDIEAAGLLPPLGKSGEGLYVGSWIDQGNGRQYYLRDNSKQHVLVFAPTGSGKGVGIVLPTLLAESDMSIVNLDIKGENWGFTAGFKQSQGYKVLRWDPTDAVSGRSAAHNPIEEIRLGTPYETGDVMNISGILADPEGKQKNDHWESTARSLLSGAITHILYKSRKEGTNGNLADVLGELTKPAQSYEDTMNEWMQYEHALDGQVFYDTRGNALESKCHPLVQKVAMEMLNREAPEASSVLSSAVKYLELYSDPVIVSNTNKCHFKMVDIMDSNTPVALYMVINPAYIDRLKPLIRLFLTQMLYALMPEMTVKNGEMVAPYKHRLLLLLDEFPAIGRVNIISSAIAYFRGWNIKLMLITQDLAQLYAIYGKEEGITGNCHLQIAYAPNRLETAQYLSDKTGTGTVIVENETVSYQGGSGFFARKSISTQQQLVARKLLSPDECMQLPGAEKDKDGNITKAGDMLLFPAGFPPIYGRQILYFQDPVFSERKKIPAPACCDKLYD